MPAINLYDSKPHDDATCQECLRQICDWLQQLYVMNIFDPVRHYANEPKTLHATKPHDFVLAD